MIGMERTNKLLADHQKRPIRSRRGRIGVKMTV
jgi:hypothetical protein